MPRVFSEFRLLENLTISEDITVYPNLDGFEDYRFHSETFLTSALTERLSLRFSYIDDYNSAPASGSKKNDLRVVTSLVYSLK